MHFSIAIACESGGVCLLGWASWFSGVVFFGGGYVNSIQSEAKLQCYVQFTSNHIKSHMVVVI
jgi:hypothetical protein